MHRYKLIICFFVCLSSFNNTVVIGQDSLENAVEVTTEDLQEQKPRIEYWKKGHYKNIAVADSLSISKNQSFERMISKYQNKDFDYVESISDKLTIWETIKNWISNFFDDLFPDLNARPADWFFDLLGICGIVFVIFLIYKLFFSGKQFIVNTSDQNGDEEKDLEFVEKNLLDVDINTYIRQALDSKNYPLVIRYQQLLNIQLLAKKGLIYWNQTKTNLELTNEIENEQIRSDFKNCSAVFDYAWFGDFEIALSQFEKMSNEFQQFQRRWS